MACTVDGALPAPLPMREHGFWHKLFFVFRARERMPRLDPRELSDHMKRDLGFRDGRS